MNAQTDSQLLCTYAESRSEVAFAELVRRHVDFTYSAALRMVRDEHLAEDVTQGVFVALAKNAAQLQERTVLSGWLHRTAQNIAAQTVRTIERRRAREQEAAAMNELYATEPDGVWEHIAPHLDAALGELSEPDRDALLLRYFERKSAQEMAQVLGVSDEAAQKRVSRAVERLREFLVKRGVTVGASGLVVVISANAVQAAPIGLSAAITTTAALGGKIITAATTATATVTKAIAMTILQKTLIAAAIVTTLAIGTGTYIVHQRNERLRVENQTDFPKESWADAGFATPRAALRTRGWAVATGNRERFKESLFITDGARNMLDQMIAAVHISDADKKLHPEFLNMTAEDSTLFPLMGQNKQNGFTNYHILSERSPSADEKLLEVETQMASAPARKETLKFRRLGRDWKVVIDEDLVDEDFKKFQRMTARRTKAER